MFLNDLLAIVAVAILFMLILAVYFFDKLGKIEKAESLPWCKSIKNAVVVFGRTIPQKCSNIFSNQKKSKGVK